MIAFLVMYLGSALRAVAMPEQYRQAELEFYRTGKPGLFELIGFAFTSIAFALLIVHFVTETALIAQIVLYAFVIMFELIMPFHFMSFYRDRMASSLKKKTSAEYRSSGLKRIGIAALIILLPLIYG
jgi:hypothetical protein